MSYCLDLALTGSRDGTVNVHCIKEGQYMRTLSPASHDLSFTVGMVSVGYQGHVVFTGHNQESHSLHVFTLNGRHIGSVNISHRVTGLICSGDKLLSGDE